MVRFRARLGWLVMVVALIASFGGVGVVRGDSPPALTLAFNFEYIRQGTAGVVDLSGPDVAGGVIGALDRTFPFFPVSGGFAALIAAPIDQKIRRDYPMTITVYLKDGRTVESPGTLRVESGEYIREPNFTIPSDRFHLLNMDIQVNEDYRLKAVYSVITPARFWEGNFAPPVVGQTTSPFGSVRSFNDGSTRRHTGLDYRLQAGVPIAASASGRVVFARGMDIHGNIVIVDHGWGVYSSYSHLSEIFVVPGQMVLQGEIIGLSGNTGRSTGPHLHWEVAVNGIWVSPQEFLKLRLPT